MKRTLIFTLVAALTSTAFAEFKAPLPEFKNEKQLAEWRAEKAAEPTSKSYAAEETAFYTGKPYLASSGSYAFRYRSYSPHVARWTSEDPSGFPDGANCSFYAPTPTNGIDPLGLNTVTVTGTPDSDTTSGAKFNILIREEAHQIGETIAGKFIVDWSVDETMSGWVVQHVQWDFSGIFNDSDDSLYSSSTPPTPSYWEAWRVNQGSVMYEAGDLFQTQSFPQSTHGMATISGKVDFYSDEVFTGSHVHGDWGNSPGSWDQWSIPEAGSLHARLTEPSWWSGSGFNHNLTVSWE
jgi:RHS repeat-associated protein